MILGGGAHCLVSALLSHHDRKAFIGALFAKTAILNLLIILRL